MAKNEYLGAASLTGTMIVLVIVLLLAWVLLRWLLKRMPAQTGSRHIKLLDRVAVAPDKCLLLVRVAEKTMLVGMSAHAVEMLCEIEDPDQTLTEAQQELPSFKSVLEGRLRREKGDAQ